MDCNTHRARLSPEPHLLARLMTGNVTDFLAEADLLIGQKIGMYGVIAIIIFKIRSA